MLDGSAFLIMLAVLTGWMDRQERNAVAYLERRASRRPFDNRPNLEGQRRAASTPAADVMADIPACALGRDCWSRFFTTEVWTWRGLVTYYTVFVIDLASRRAHILGSTPHPHESFMRQVARTLTTADDGTK